MLTLKRSPALAPVEKTKPEVFAPEEIAAMTAAFDVACTALELTDIDDPMNEILAEAIVMVAASGERDPAIIADRAINALGATRPATA
jgi:hypothetical protein